jgi:type VI protein secretion system component VasF
MSELTVDERAELEALRARVQELERERAEQMAASNAAVATLQERVYWLDRWHLDLNALMARPGAAEFRAAVRIAREAIRTVRRAKRKLLG